MEISARPTSVSDGTDGDLSIFWRGVDHEASLTITAAGGVSAYVWQRGDRAPMVYEAGALDLTELRPVLDRLNRLEPSPGEVRLIAGKRCRFIERELEGDKWEVLS